MILHGLKHATHNVGGISSSFDEFSHALTIGYCHDDGQFLVVRIDPQASRTAIAAQLDLLSRFVRDPKGLAAGVIEKSDVEPR